jgi:hypothetical protein
MPYLLVGAVGYLIYRQVRIRAALEEARQIASEANASYPPPG